MTATRRIRCIKKLKQLLSFKKKGMRLKKNPVFPRIRKEVKLSLIATLKLKQRKRNRRKSSKKINHFPKKVFRTN